MSWSLHVNILDGGNDYYAPAPSIANSRVGGWGTDHIVIRTKPVNAAEIPFAGYTPIGGRATLSPNSTLAYNFVKRLDVRIASFAIFPPTGNQTTPIGKPGWWEDLSSRIVKRLNSAEIPFSGYNPAGVPGIVTYKQGWFRDIDQWIDKPFPVAVQQFASYPPHAAFPTPFLGWYGIQYDYHFTKPYPVQLQRAWELFNPVGMTPSGSIPRGGESPWIDYRFVQPFAVQDQQFAGWPAEVVPTYFPPGSGKRYKPPTDYLPEPSDRGPNKPLKPVRPVWDREPSSAEVPKVEVPQKGPPPLPPLSIFRDTAPVRVMSPDGLPTLQEYVPRNPLGLQAELQRAREEQEAVAALRALGLYKGGQ